MTLNWPQLVAKGRAKDIGVPWTEEEQIALHELGIPAKFVRDGILTAEAYKKAQAKDEAKGAPTSRQSRAAIEKKATALGIEFTPEVPDATLVSLIEKAEAASTTGNGDAPVVTDAGDGESVPTRAELETKATALGIEFTAGTRDSTLVKKIEEAETAQAANT